MIQRLTLTLFIIPLALGAIGCQDNRELQQELLNLKNETTLQLELLNRHNDFLTRKTEVAEEQMAKLVSSDAQLSREFNSYASRPDQIKREILNEVELRGEMARNRQVAFSEEFSARLDEKTEYLADKRQTRVSEYEASLSHTDSFFRFVFTAQDSMNMEFVNRFEDRPWYQSLLGRWEEQESAPTP